MKENSRTIELFVPGRLCLFGEHSDWAGRYRNMNAGIVPGAAIVTCIEQGIYATAEASDTFTISSTAPEIKDIWTDFGAEMDVNELDGIARSGSFFSYCSGVAAYMLETYEVGGLKIDITSMTLPMKRGLSSSAAICVLIARAFNRIYKLGMSTKEEMNAAYCGEQRTSSRCGRLDQVCAYGGRTMLMKFNGDEVSVKKISIGADFHWVFANLNAQKDTIKILRDLNKAYPFASGPVENDVQDALGPSNITVIDRAKAMLEAGDQAGLGQLMCEAQDLFDRQVAPACPEELTSPKLHSVLSDPEIQEWLFGGKGVGSQGDGSVQFLTRDEECQKKLIAYLEGNGMDAYALTLKKSVTVRKAIIPVAGFGTRMYPVTRMIKKDFLPVVDNDGLVKPAILILLEDLLRSDIEKICLVLGSEQEREQYREFFEKEISEEHFAKLSAKCQEYENKIKEISKRLEFVYQTEKKGFGHAVYQAAGFAAGEPVLLLLGDTIYRSDRAETCSRQLINAFDQYGKPMVSIHETPLDDVSYYGIITGAWKGGKEGVMNMSRMVEKPTKAYAEEHLGVPGDDGKDRYWSVFGQYILTPEVFEQLRKDIEASRDNGKEIELTAALEAVRAEYGMIAVKVAGRMFDLGNPKAYRNAIKGFCE